MKKLLLLSSAVLFIVSIGFSQTGEIKGIIKDEKSGEPIFGAAVYIEIGGVKKGAVTDPDGKYTIKPVNPGVHQVYMEVMGYQTKLIQKVDVLSNRITYVNSEMNPTPEMLTGIDVIEYAEPLISKDEPYVKIISAKSIGYSPQKFNPIAIVGQLEGVTVAANGKDVYIRGSRPQSTQFITDNMKSITGGIGIPGMAIGSIKVYTGGVPAQYGDVTGGVIVVETKSYFDYAQQFHQ